MSSGSFCSSQTIIDAYPSDAYRTPTSNVFSNNMQILAGANKEAIAVAQASNFNFIRAEGFVFGHIADEGYIESCAGTLLRYRHQLNADHISILTDIKKKHR